MKPGKVIRNVLIAVVGLLVVVLVALQIILRPAVLTKLVNKFAADYVEGDVSFGNIKAHVIKSFPFLNLEADDFSLTYPHDRYAQWDTIYPDSGRRFSLMKAGRGEEVDTLASFRHLSVSLNYMGIIRGDGFHIRKAELEHPRIFAHYYDSSAANWDILPIGGPKKDTTKKPAPRIEINKVHMSGRPFIVFTNPRDTIHGMFSMRRLSLDGHLDTRKIEKMESALEVDSLFVSGRLPADTVAVALQSLRAKGGERHLELDAKAQAWLATRSHGRLRVPLGISLDGDLPERQDNSLEVQLNRLGLDVSALHLDGKGSVTAAEGAYDLDLEASIEKCPLGKLIDEYQDNLPVLKKIDTDARLNVNAIIKGVYGGGRTPSIDADMLVEDGHIYLFYSRCCYENNLPDQRFDKFVEESNILAVELDPAFWYDKEAKMMPTIHPSFVAYDAEHPEIRKDKWVQIISYCHEPQEWENGHISDYESSHGQKHNRRWAEGSMTIPYVIDGVKKYLIFYSCNNYENALYGIGVAVADQPLGPYHKYGKNPIIHQVPDISLYSTGHGCVVEKDGELYYVFHGRESMDQMRILYQCKLHINSFDDITISDIVKGNLI